MKKSILFFAAIVAFYFNASAQGDPDWIWEQKLEAACLSNGGELDIKDITVSYDHPNFPGFEPLIYVTGKFRGDITLGSYTLSSLDNCGSGSSNYDGFLAQYDINGNLKWVTRFGKLSTTEETGSGVTSDLYGNVYVTGYIVPTYNSGTGMYDITFGDNLLRSTSLSFPTGITTSSSNTSNLSSSATIPFVTKFDKYGNAKWVSIVEAPNGRGISVALSPDHDGSNAAGQLPDGDLYITGYFLDYINYPNGNSNCRVPAGTTNFAAKTFVAKYATKTGNIVWANYINNDPNNSSSYNVGRGVTVEGDYIDPNTMTRTSDQDVYIVGEYNEYAYIDHPLAPATPHVLPTPTQVDGYVAKLDHTTGGFEWEQTISSNGDDYVRGCDMYPNNAELYIIGDYEGNNNLSINGAGGSVSTSGVGNVDVFVAKYDWNGNVGWGVTLGSTRDDHGTDIIAFNESTSELHIAGTYQEALTDGQGQTLQKISIGTDHDNFIAKIDRTNGNTLWADGVDASLDNSTNYNTLETGPQIAYERSTADEIYMSGFFKAAETPLFTNSLSTSQVYAGFVTARRNCNCPAPINVQVQRDVPAIDLATVTWDDAPFASCVLNYFIDYTEQVPPFTQQQDGPYAFSGPSASYSSNPIALNPGGNIYEWVVFADCGYGQSTAGSVFQKNGGSLTAKAAPVITEGISRDGSVKVYPNPVGNQLTINGSFADNNETLTSVEVTDILGRTIKTVAIDGGVANYQLPLADLQSGVYIVVVNSTSNSYSFKITKE